MIQAMDAGSGVCGDRDVGCFPRREAHMSVQERVARGVRWLDGVSPGWRDAIALSSLDIMSNTQCVLGQVFSDAAASDESTSGAEYAVRHLVPGSKSRDRAVYTELSA